MLLAGADRQRIIEQRGALRHDTRGSLRDAAELHDTLRDEVDVFLDLLVDLVEQFVQRDELRSFDIPVRLFAHGLEIDGFRQPFVEQANGLGAAGGRQVDLRAVEQRLAVEGARVLNSLGHRMASRVARFTPSGVTKCGRSGFPTIRPKSSQLFSTRAIARMVLQLRVVTEAPKTFSNWPR